MANQNSPVLQWANLLKDTRQFFESNNFLEVSTPYLVDAGAMEASIDPLTAHWQQGSAQLHTSPEFHMKRLVSDLGRDIYQVCRCFRDDPETGIHWKEFTMLEFYRINTGYNAVLNDMKAYLSFVANRALPFHETTVIEAFETFAGLRVNWEMPTDELRSIVQTRGTVPLDATDNWEDIFFKVLVQEIEPKLPRETPFILKDYPLLVSPLSAPGNTDHTSERFEIYWQGMELCNGCTELTDGIRLLKRIEHENNLRKKLNKNAHPWPETLLKAMNSLPPCAGVAVGLDRLALCLLRS